LYWSNAAATGGALTLYDELCINLNIALFSTRTQKPQGDTMIQMILASCLLISAGFAKAQEAPKPTKKETPTTTKTDNNKGKKMLAKFDTSMGKFTVQLFPDKSPKTVDNFVGLAKGTKEWTDPSGKKVKKPLYNGTIFHRVIPGFMIQGGDPLGNGTGGPGYKFDDEKNDLKHSKVGILSMANAGPNTNGSQFFVTVAETSWLDGKHTIFGEVIEGMDVVMKISTTKAVDTKPVEKVVIKSITIEEKN